MIAELNRWILSVFVISLLLLEISCGIRKYISNTNNFEENGQAGENLQNIDGRISSREVDVKNFSIYSRGKLKWKLPPQLSVEPHARRSTQFLNHNYTNSRAQHGVLNPIFTKSDTISNIFNYKYINGSNSQKYAIIYDAKRRRLNATRDAEMQRKSLFRRDGITEFKRNSYSKSKLSQLASQIGSQSTGGILSEFYRHQIINPTMQHSRTKRSISNTKQTDGHVPHLTLGLNLGEKDVLLDLQLNRDLLSRQFSISNFRNNTHSTRKQNLQDVDMCHYQGFIKGVPSSWAAVSTCDGIRGVVYDGEDTHYLEPIPGVTIEPSDPHFAFSHRDLIPKNLTCGYKGRPFQPQRELFHDEEFKRLLRYKREASNDPDSGSTKIRGPFNANSLSRYVELVLVADKAEFEKFGSDVSKIHKRFKDIANIVNALYQPLNIFVALVGVEVWEEEDPIEVSTDGDKTLTNFLNYRKVRLIPKHPNDNAQLLTGKAFDSGVVGKALKGPICTYQYSGGVNMDHSESVGLVATTVAHEMGHNFGMEHDTEEDCKCPDKRCIMAPSSGTRSPSHWSSCSHEYLAISFERSMDYCLRNRPSSLFESPICGNGFVEAGEQCDCGLYEHCDNPCCDAHTCMLFPNATCATGHCCDLKTCRPKSAGTECRSSVQECDLPEFCSGDSEFCPADFSKQDGESCQGGKAYCYQGMCRTHEHQCRLLWGPTGKNSHDKCYNLNREGNTNGNCGYNWANNTYKRCTTDDVKCGMMHCKHFNERLEFGMESVSKVSHRFIADKTQGVIPCRVAQVDLGLDMVDPGLAPDGAQCGYNKMCVDQKCLEVSSLRLHVCDCNGRGVCNNRGHCHCKVGFAWPDCLYPGLGGSEDSGPASNPNATSDFVVGMFVFFLGVVPLVVIVLCLVYYGKGNLKHWWLSKGRPATSRLSSKDGQCRPSSGTPAKHGAKSPLHEGSAAPGVRSDSPPSSDGSKSNSPLLNGRANGASKSSDSRKVSSQIFGKYEGFSLSPINEKPKNPIKEKPKKASDAAHSQLGTTTQTNSMTSPPASSAHWKASPNPLPSNVWPPPDKRQTLDISGPSLQTSTNPCVKGISALPSPTRVAPLPPPLKKADAPRDAPQRPKSVPDASVLIGQENPPPSSVSFELNKEQGKLSAVARIASFLSKKEKNPTVSDAASITSDSSQQSNTLPRKASKINRESLLQLEISHPMQLQATELPSNLVPVRTAPDPPMSKLKPSEIKAAQEKPPGSVKVSWDVVSEDTEKGESKAGQKEQFMRSGSVREPSVTPRPVIPKFGSMRAPRPKSLPQARPSQPPPRPPLPAIPGTPETEYFYDDCITVQFSQSSAAKGGASPQQEGIYATIDEESPTSETPTPQTEKKKEKKNIFSMLYAKSKKKKTSEPEVTEPLYCNIDASTDVNTQTSKDEDIADGHSSIIAADRTSRGSTDEGGLLSEIVSELATREPLYVNTLSKKGKDQSLSKSPISPTSPIKEASSVGSAKQTRTPVKGKSEISDALIDKTNNNKIAPAKPLAAFNVDDKIKSPSSYVPYSNLKPRGVFTYFKNSSSEQNASLDKSNQSSKALPVGTSNLNTLITHVPSTPYTKTDKASKISLSASLAGVKSVSAEAKSSVPKVLPIAPNVKLNANKSSGSSDKKDSNIPGSVTSAKSDMNSVSSRGRPAFPPDKILSPDNKPAPIKTKTFAVAQKKSGAKSENNFAGIHKGRSTANPGETVGEVSSLKPKVPSTTAKPLSAPSKGAPKTTPVEKKSASSTPSPLVKQPNAEKVATKGSLGKKAVAPTSSNARTLKGKSSPSDPSKSTASQDESKLVSLSTAKKSNRLTSTTSPKRVGIPSVSASSSLTSKNSVLAAAAKSATPAASNVASLQQKFEKDSQNAKATSTSVKRPPSGRGRPLQK